MDDHGISSLSVDKMGKFRVTFVDNGWMIGKYKSFNYLSLETATNDALRNKQRAMAVHVASGKHFWFDGTQWHGTHR